MSILIDDTKLLASIESTLATQLKAQAQCELPPAILRNIARNIAHSVMTLELDETHVVDLIDTRSLLTQRERHHDRCMTPFDDAHLTCPIAAGREA